MARDVTGHSREITATQQPAPHSISAAAAANTKNLSRESLEAPFETLFNDFHLMSVPVYNFYSPDEETNESDEAGDRRVEDIPRYVRLLWDVAPDLTRQMKRSDSSKSEVAPVTFATSAKTESSSARGSSFSIEHLNNFSLARSSLANAGLSKWTIGAIVEISKRADDVATKQSIDEETFLADNGSGVSSINDLITNFITVTRGGISRVSDKSSYVVSSPENGGEVLITDQGGQGAGLTVRTRSAESQNGKKKDVVFDHASRFTRADNPGTKPIAKVRFVETAIDGATSESAVAGMSKPEHAEGIVAVSQMASDLSSISRMRGVGLLPNIPIVSFPSPDGLPTLEYIGYVIEKYKMQSDGSFTLVKEIEIPLRDCGEYIDTMVVYGGTYRYRMYAVARWTRQSDKIANTQILHASIADVLRNMSSYIAGEWSFNWSYATVVDIMPPPPPDEIFARPVSRSREVHVSFKLPWNPQRDISSIILYRKIVDASGKDMTDWSILQEFEPSNGLYIDRDVDYAQSSGESYIYAAQCVSLHNEESPLSDQMLVSLNSDFVFSGEIPVKMYSQAGVKFGYSGAFLTIPPRAIDHREIVFGPFIVTGRQGLGNSIGNDISYVMRVESLDTGERSEALLNVRYEQKEPIVNRIESTLMIDKRETPQNVNMLHDRLVQAGIVHGVKMGTVERHA